MKTIAGKNFDAIIVGAGTAGMPCAITAAESGARVIVVEKTAEIGGTLHVSGGDMSAGGTRRQYERGIHDSPNQHFEDLVRISRRTVDPVLARLAVEEAPRTVDWLDDLGFPFNPEAPVIAFGHEPYRIPRTYAGPRAGRDILETIRPEWDKHVAGGRIALLTEHELTDLVVEGGTVVGVSVRLGDAIRQFRAPSVALTTGGYASNARFLADVTPSAPRLVSVAPEASQGDGIFAALRIGARFRGAEKYLPTAAGIEMPSGSGRADLWAAWPTLHGPSRQPREIYVDIQGERFMNEDDQSPDRRERIILDLPDHCWWVVFDNDSIDDGPPLVPQWGHAGIREKAAEGDVVWAADTLEELASKAGINPAGLERTVARFNAAVHSKSDPLGRFVLTHPIATPPFYALRNVATTFISFGGLAIDIDSRVVDDGGSPIPGLYAAGEIIGAAATSGNAFCGGMLVTPALSFGRLLGRRLATSKTFAL